MMGEKIAQPQTVAEALEWQIAFSESIISHRAAIFNAIHRGESLRGTRFFALTYDEVDAYFSAEQAEIDAMCIVNIVAAAEAAIRADYLTRVGGRFKDSLSQMYVAFHGRLPTLSKARPPFDERGILDELKNSGVVMDHLVTDFRHVLRVRHWYAHGRYWLLKSNAILDDPADVGGTCIALLAALPP